MDSLFRQLPAFKGKARLARWLMAKNVNSKKDVAVTGKYGVQYVLPNIIESIGFDVFINGEYEPGIQDLICKLLPKNGSFLDLGGNIGAIVLPVAKRRPDIRAFSVEAAPWIFQYLDANLKRNKLDNVRLINNALFDKDDIDLDFFSPHDKYGKGSLAAVFTSDAVKVRSKKIDTLVAELGLERVDIIKIDIEGFEYFAFRGAEKLLQGPAAPRIIFEFVDWAEARANGLQPGAAQQLLMEMGYLLYEIRDDKLIKCGRFFTEGSFNIIASKTELKV